MLVKVWNKNVHPFTQKLNEKTYTIPAQEYIELDEEEADRLVKAYSPIKVDYDGNALPISYKMLEVDKDDLKKAREKRENRTRTGNYVCQACGYVAANKWELNGHSLDQHKDIFEDLQEAAMSISADNKKRSRKKA